MAKRLFDIIFSSFLLVLTAPLFLLEAIAIRLDSKGPIFFKQERVGLNGKLFKIYKFRTMVENAAQMGPQISPRNDPRVTRVGRFLRKWYLDELPQLFNVLKGDMSVAGPRPEVPKYVSFYTPEERKVLTVKPGLVGPATVAFRNEEAILANKPDPEHFYITHLMHERLRLDLQYVENQSLLYDLKLVLQMCKAALMGYNREDKSLFS